MKDYKRETSSPRLINNTNNNIKMGKKARFWLVLNFSSYSMGSRSYSQLPTYQEARYRLRMFLSTYLEASTLLYIVPPSFSLVNQKLSLVRSKVLENYLFSLIYIYDILALFPTFNNTVAS